MSLTDHRPTDLRFGQIGKVIAVFKRKRFLPVKFYFDRREDCTRREVIDLRRSVGIDYAVATVDAVRIPDGLFVRPGEPLAILLLHIRRRTRNALVLEHPDATPRAFGTLPHLLPCLGERTEVESERVRELAREKRTVQARRKLAYLRRVDVVEVIEHRARRRAVGEHLFVDARILRIARRARRIELHHELAAFDADVGERILVADRPGDDTRMQLVARDCETCALFKNLEVVRIAKVLRAHSKRNLVYGIEPQFVAEVEESLVRRIVRKTHAVEVSVLDKLRITSQLVDCDGASVARTKIVVVDTVQLDGTSVQLQHRAVARDLAKTDALFHAVASNLRDKRVEVRRLACPEPCILDNALHRRVA